MPLSFYGRSKQTYTTEGSEYHEKYNRRPTTVFVRKANFTVNIYT